MSITGKKEQGELRRLVEAGAYDQAYQLCERLYKQNEAKTSPEALYYGCLALFGLGHIHQAEDWVAIQGAASEFNTRFLYLEAYLHLHGRNFEKALLNWTRILQLDPSETLADKLIEKLKGGESAVFREIRDPEAFRLFVPGAGKSVPARQNRSQRSGVGRDAKVGAPSETADPGASGEAGRASEGKSKGTDIFRRFVVFLILMAILGVGLGIIFPRFFGTVPGGSAAFDPQKLPEAPAGGAIIAPEQFDETPRFIYISADDVVRDYKRARRLLTEGMVNQAGYLIGKIELSNAGFEFKERARFLREFIPEISRENFRDPVSVTDVFNEPYLYRGAQVLWSGQIKNLTDTAAGARFFLVQSEELRASLDARFNHARLGDVESSLDHLKEGNQVQVFGDVVERSSDGRIVLRVREIGRPSAGGE